MKDREITLGQTFERRGTTTWFCDALGVEVYKAATRHTRPWRARRRVAGVVEELLVDGVQRQFSKALYAAMAAVRQWETERPRRRVSASLHDRPEALRQDELDILIRIRDEIPGRWRNRINAYFEGRDTLSFLTIDERSALQRIRNRRGPKWITYIKLHRYKNGTVD